MSREYITAGKAVDAVINDGITFKAYCASNLLGKIDFALASETLKYQSVLARIVARTNIDKAMQDVGNRGMILVLCYELLVGAGKIRGGGSVKRMLMERIEDLKSALKAEMKAEKATSISELLPIRVQQAQLLPQYLRINPLQLSNRKVTEKLVSEEIKEHCPSAIPDTDIPHLWMLPPRWPSFGQHERVADGCVIVQDKASCFPSQILVDAWPGGDVIDCCAAPGNKTSHVAAGLTELKMASSSSGKKISNSKIDMVADTVHAFDKSTRRAELLARRMSAAGADKLVTVQCTDFLTVDINREDLQNVRAVLCDPSCSGSGVLRDIGRNADEENDDSDERLHKLRTFQVQVVLQAMSFPNAEVCVYSTCSVHVEENESVVAEILASRPDWDVAAPSRLHHWKRRGHDHEGLTKEQSQCLIRCLPEDGLNGFFVTLFIKNPHFKGELPVRKVRKVVNTEIPIENTSKAPTRKKKRNAVEEKTDGSETKKSIGNVSEKQKNPNKKEPKPFRPFKRRK
jgi:25S rRNA (cytosine2278-C5)-methyltransferase